MMSFLVWLAVDRELDGPSASLKSRPKTGQRPAPSHRGGRPADLGPVAWRRRPQRRARGRGDQPRAELGHVFVQSLITNSSKEPTSNHPHSLITQTCPTSWPQRLTLP